MQNEACDLVTTLSLTIINSTVDIHRVKPDDEIWNWTSTVEHKYEYN